MGCHGIFSPHAGMCYLPTPRGVCAGFCSALEVSVQRAAHSMQDSGETGPNVTTIAGSIFSDMMFQEFGHIFLLVFSFLRLKRAFPIFESI